MTVDASEIEAAARRLALAGRPLEVHVSLRSFGGLTDGAATVVDGLLAAGCTVVAATMAPETFGVDESKGWLGLPYDSSRTEVAAWLGGFSAHVAGRADRARCALPAGELAAIGPLAERLIAAETSDDVYGPLRELAALDGAVVLMGVGLTRMTLLHLAEVEAGRRPFVHWGRCRDDSVVRVRAGECSEGFENLADTLRKIERTASVGSSRWRAFPAHDALALAAEAIHRDPAITHCPDPDCAECAVAVAGGPD